MFAGHAEGASLVNLTEKGAGTEIAVFNPEVAGLNRVQDCPEQRAFLRMAIFAWKDIGDHTQGRFIDYQRFAGQGTPLGFTQFLDAMLTGFEAVAIDDFDPITPALSTCALILLNCYLICEFPCLSLGGNKHAAEHHLCPLRQGASDRCHGSSSLGEAPGCPPHR